jgi:hypothetical protein
MICNIEKKHNIMIKTEPLEPEDYFQPTGICADPGCRRLQQGIQVITPHSNVAMKHAQRRDIENLVQEALAVQPRVNIYLFDDWLPLREDSCRHTLLSDHLLRKFGANRIRIWAPNLKPDVVAAHEALSEGNQCPMGWITAACGCWHTFNTRWAPDICMAGGLDVVFADCFRGFEHGCGALVADLLKKRMFRRRTDANDKRRCHLTFAVSDRHQRSQGWSAATATLQVLIDMGALFSDENCPYVTRVVSQAVYGRTMHYFKAEVCERQWVQSLPGFVVHIQHLQKA